MFGAVLTLGVCRALGRLLFRRLRLTEDVLIEWLCGSAILSLIVFVLCAVHLARVEIFLALSLVALFAGRPALPSRPPLLFLALFSFYGIFYLSRSLGPEVSPDGMAYHLGFVARYFANHGFLSQTDNMYGSFPQGLEMLFLFAFAFGKHSAAATVHCLFLLTLPLLVYAYGKRLGKPAAGACAGVLVFLSPAVGVDGVSAYNDVALATVVFAMFYLLEVWRDSGNDALLLPVGLLAGFCFAIKYTGFAALLYAAVVILWRRPRASWVPALAASLLIAPWLIKNWIEVWNPVSPFFNRIFRNPFIHVSFEDSYRQYFHTYGLLSLKPLFRMVTVTGELGGQIGPVFLLAPLALLSLRTTAGRRCMLAAAFFLLPYPANIGARFLIPALPFIALGIAQAMGFYRPLQLGLMIAAAVLASPRVIDDYRAPAGSWQIARHAPSLESSPEYRLAQTLNAHVQSGARVWSSIPVAQSYTTADVLVFYYSAANEVVRDILLTPALPDLQPLWNWRFTFPTRMVTHLRLMQNARSAGDIWSIGEALFFDGNTQRKPAHASATPFPWDIGLALDGNPVTRWSSWESIHPGMHVDFDFESPAALDRVELHGSHDQWKIDVQVDGIAAKLEKLEIPIMDNLRPVATRTVRARGIGYLLIGDEFPAAADMRGDPARWGMQRLAVEGTATLYRIQ